jgi:hypothetical protein
MWLVSVGDDERSDSRVGHCIDRRDKVIPATISQITQDAAQRVARIALHMNELTIDVDVGMQSDAGELREERHDSDRAFPNRERFEPITMQPVNLIRHEFGYFY